MLVRKIFSNKKKTILRTEFDQQIRYFFILVGGGASFVNKLYLLSPAISQRASMRRP